MTTFVISPSDEFAGVLDETDGIVRLVLPASQEGRTLNACNYFSRFPNTAILEVADVDEGVRQFSNYKDASLTFDFAMLLLDSSLSASTRSSAAEELNELLELNENRHYVLDILLAAPLPSSADIVGAIKATTRWGNARSFFETVSESQTRVRHAFNAWLSLLDDQNVRTLGVDFVRGQLVRHGVFRQLVLDGKAKTDKAGLNARIVLGLQAVCDSRITTALLNEYFSHLPEGVRLARPVHEELELDGQDQVDTPRAIVRPRVLGGAEEKLANVQSQIDRIAEEVSNRNDQLAYQFLEELIVSQTRDTTDHSHVVKSLCNLAKKCRVCGRRDIGLECLARARTFRSGVDVRLCLQIGNELRGIREFEQALAFYESAKQLDRDGVHRDRIELEIIRVTADTGDYQDALTKLFLGLETVQYQPSYLTYIATLNRKLGKLALARDYYGQALLIDKTYDSARAGLAECNKQSGRHFKAIKSYLQIKRDFPDLDEHSSKVYAQAESRLYRLTHQPRKAFDILIGLNQQYPSDAEVHLQLAKLYMAEGDTVKARQHYQKAAQGQDLEKIAAKLFLVADGRQIDLPEIDFPTIDSGVLPEEMGLLKCSRAMMAIRANNFELACNVVRGIGYTDRLHSDFGAVLGFHAAMEMDRRYNFRSNQTLARIAKRGYRELKQSVFAISEGDFNTAKELELRVCSLIA